MKAILEFNLPKEQSEFTFAIQGSDWWYICKQLDDWLRNEIKHPDQYTSGETLKAYKECRSVLWDAISNANLNLHQ